VKVGQVVLLEVTSLDVVHSLFIYDLGIKIDANPGRINHYWFKADAPGIHRIVCAEFCGVSHYIMTGTLFVDL
jgi:heme/copper-type cytochrome/quinol oxidase subunit 2